jgi:hypothetical protein
LSRNDTWPRVRGGNWSGASRRDGTVLDLFPLPPLTLD